MRAFLATVGRLEWMDGLVGGRCTCWRRHVSKQRLTHRCVNFSTGPEIDACGLVGRYFRRGFHQKVDWRETLLLVCSPAGMEVAGKSCRKKLSAARCSDDSLASVRLREDCNMNGV